MSWSLSGSSTTKDDLRSSIDADAIETQLGYAEQNGVSDEQTAQIDAALEAASTLAKACGLDADSVVIACSGHANPGHGPKEGWADEMISVSVRVTRT